MIIPLVGADLRADPRLADYTSLKDVMLRFKLESERGLYMVESINVITCTLQIRHSPRSFLTSERWLPQLAPLIREVIGDEGGGEAPIPIADGDVSHQIIGSHLHRRAPAAMQHPFLPTVSELLPCARGGEPACRVVILEDFVDRTNAGMAFRSAAVLGVDAVLVIPNCVDPLYRRLVRASMGAVFQVPWVRLEEWSVTGELHEAGFTLVVLTLCDNFVSPENFVEPSLYTAPDTKAVLVMGAEGDGLNRKTIAVCDVVV